MTPKIKKQKILIVDDMPLNIQVLNESLQERYQTFFATNGVDAINIARKELPDLILLDVMMPGMDGFEVCTRIRAESALSDVPILMISALDDRESRLKGIEVGVDDFISKPFDRTELRARVRTILRLNRYRKLRDEHALLEGALSELQITYDRTIEGWVKALDIRDQETEGHTRRVTEMTLQLARAMGMTEEELTHVQRGSLSLIHISEPTRPY